MVDRSALRDVCDQLIDTIMEHGWSLSGISTESCVEHMPGVDGHLLRSALCRLSGQRLSASPPLPPPPAAASAEGTEQAWTLDYKAVSRSVARKLFRQRVAETGEVSSPPLSICVWCVMMMQSHTMSHTDCCYDLLYIVIFYYVSFCSIPCAASVACERVPRDLVSAHAHRADRGACLCTPLRGVSAGVCCDALLSCL